MGGWVGARFLVKNFKCAPNIISPTVPLCDALGSVSDCAAPPSPGPSAPHPQPSAGEAPGRKKRRRQAFNLQLGVLILERLRPTATVTENHSVLPY